MHGTARARKAEALDAMTATSRRIDPSRGRPRDDECRGTGPIEADRREGPDSIERPTSPREADGPPRGS